MLSDVIENIAIMQQMQYAHKQMTVTNTFYGLTLLLACTCFSLFLSCRRLSARRDCTARTSATR
jgi:hypothetical protein